MSEELKPCPFCGSNALLRGNLFIPQWWVVCEKCFAKTTNVGSKRTAIKNWNRRTP